MQFEAAFGGERASILRNELRAVVSSELGLSPESGKKTHGRKSARATHYTP
jgi:hypothetical protein